MSSSGIKNVTTSAQAANLVKQGYTLFCLLIDGSTDAVTEHRYGQGSFQVKVSTDPDVWQSPVKIWGQPGQQAQLW